MNKRILGTFLWFQVGWTSGAMATFFLNAPAGLDVVLAITAAIVVWWDPGHRLWPQGHGAPKSERSSNALRPSLTTE